MGLLDEAKYEMCENTISVMSMKFGLSEEAHSLLRLVYPSLLINNCGSDVSRYFNYQFILLSVIYHLFSLYYGL